MKTVVISPKFPIIIPKEVRERMKLRPGQHMKVLVHEGRIELVPVLSFEEAYGFLKGLDTEIEREGVDRV
ncbi:MAG TPA: AbrB/MazE/SpoVT family DNA-binding domain-containing protein [Anaerolineales bacterium]|nr:AbrB/MazE/SpoVT family DNA-binding domain-containing protein [Anaerolineales bacterium]